MPGLLTLHHPIASEAYYRSGVWRTDTMYGLLHMHAATRGEAIGLSDGVSHLTWAEWLACVDRVAADLHAAGLVAGDRVSVWLPNRVEASIVFLACARNGYVCNPSLHQNYTVAEVVDLLQRIQAKALIAQPGYAADARTADIFSAASRLPALRKIIAVRSRNEELPAHASPFPSVGRSAPLPAPVRDPDKVVYLAFTSGTTGTPKGVMHSDNTLLANARALASDWGQDASMVLLSLSPASHHIATVGLMQTLVTGGRFVLSQPSSRDPAIEWIERSQATYVMGVPTHAIDVLAAAAGRGCSQLHRVKIFYMAGAPIPPSVARQFMDLGVKPQNIYGMTENGSHQYTLPDDDLETIIGTCGRSCRAYEIKLFSQEDRNEEVAPGQVGEIGGRGGTLMLGYFGDQLATESAFNASGWFMSGDLGELDSRGNLRVVGRAKDLIIRGGHNIHPARIESLAMRNPSVAKAAAFAVADERLGEKVCLAVIPTPGQRPASALVLSHLHASGLSKYDMPEYFVCLESFPLTASGKVLKRELMAWVRGGRIVPEPVRWNEPS